MESDNIIDLPADGSCEPTLSWNSITSLHISPHLSVLDFGGESQPYSM